MLFVAGTKRQWPNVRGNPVKKKSRKNTETKAATGRQHSPIVVGGLRLSVFDRGAHEVCFVCRTDWPCEAAMKDPHLGVRTVKAPRMPTKDKKQLRVLSHTASLHADAQAWVEQWVHPDRESDATESLIDLLEKYQRGE